jgi:hypothetical protein
MPAEKEPGLSMPECSKKLGEMWRELSEAEKKPYQVSKQCPSAAHFGRPTAHCSLLVQAYLRCSCAPPVAQEHCCAYMAG